MKFKPAIYATIVILLAACGGGSISHKTNEAVKVALTATNEARTQFTAWDKQHQLSIVDKAQTREQAESELQSYREKRQKIIQAFTVAYSSMAAASALVPLVQAGERVEKDLLGLLVDAAMAVKSVIASIQEIRDAFDSKAAPAPEPSATPEPTTLPPAAEPATP